MSISVVSFDQSSSWSFTNGAALSTNGIKHPSLQSIGILTGASSADGSFSDTNGFGQVDYDSAGYAYVGDYANNRVQRFVLTNGVWTYDSKVSSIGTLVGGGSNSPLVAIDRSRNQIHIANSDHFTASNWISVWSLTNWPTLTTGNRIRQYGANSSTDVAGRAMSGFGLAIDDTYAVVSSGSSPYRQLRWNHVTGALQNESNAGIIKSKWTTDGSGNWWYCIGFGSANAGVYKADPSTFAAGTRLDTAAVSNYWRRNRFTGGAPLCPVYSNGKVYARGYLGDTLAWNSDNSFSDEYVPTGPLGSSGEVKGGSGWAVNSSSASGKSGLVVDQNNQSWLWAWCANADNTASQCFYIAWPMTTSTATVTYIITDDTATLKQLLLSGVNLSADKCRISWKKNSGSYHALTLDKASKSGEISALGDHTFVINDTVTFKVELSTWDRLDGNSSFNAVRDKLAPTDVRLNAVFDTSGDLIVNTVTPSFTARMGDSVSFRAKIAEL